MPVTVTDDLFGKNLLFLRKKYTLSRLALAKLIGTAAVLVGAWEECRVYPTLARICTIFQTDVQTLLHKEMN